jgi:hypothetical protein
MTIPISSRWRRAIALGLVWLPAGTLASAADSDPVWTPPGLPAPSPTQRTVQDVEIIHGTTKVYPIYRPKPTPVLPAEAKPWPGAPPYVPPPPAIHEDPRPVPPPPTEIFVRIEDRQSPPAPAPTPAAPSSPPIILTGYTLPLPPGGPYSGSAPWLLPAPVAPVVPPPAATPAQPQTVVVIREQSADARPAVVEQPRGVTLGGDTALGIGVGVLGVGIGLAGWRRKTAATAAAAAAMRHPTPPPPVTHDGLLLMGKYNAGPRREQIERFDLGPSYQVEQEEKKKVEEANQGAVLEFILSQNIALHTDLFGPPEEPAPEPEAPEAAAAETAEAPTDHAGEVPATS